MHTARLIFLLVTVLMFAGCARDDRAQVAADTRAGVQALRAAFEAGVVTAELLVILEGIDKRLPAVAGVNSSEWPAPKMTPAQIRTAPQDYSDSAPPEPATWTFYAALTTAGVVALGLIRVAAPLIPGGGPIIQGAANLAWSLMASHKQKQADRMSETIAHAAHTAKPLLDELRAMPLDQLPPSLRTLAQSPYIAAAVEHLANPRPPTSPPVVIT